MKIILLFYSCFIVKTAFLVALDYRLASQENSLLNLKIKLHHTELLLLPQRVLYISRYKVLCIADWHLGKAAHFRKSGIALPKRGRDNGFGIIDDLMQMFIVEKIIFLGDLFHSKKNNEWESFSEFVNQRYDKKFILIKGNHDIIPDEHFHNIGIETFDELVLNNKIHFTHHPLFDAGSKDYLNIAGHIHPGVTIEQKAKQRLRLPCFHYRNGTLLLPAFGEMTGIHVLPQQAEDIVFPIFHNEVMKL